VIDENVLFFAHRGTDPQGRPSHHSAALLTEISVNGHRVCFSKETLARYSSKLDLLKGEIAIAVNVPKIFWGLLASKLQGREVDTSSVDAPKEINAKDAPFVTVAIAASPSILATYDSPLLHEMDDADLASQKVRGLLVRQALEEARKPDC